MADRQTFVEVLLETAGPRAVTEYIDAVAHSMSPQLAAPLQQWWDAQRADADADADADGEEA